MIDENQDLRLSELVDGELTTDDVNLTLLEVLPDKAARDRLLRMLRLRMALAPWRMQSAETADLPSVPRFSPPVSGRGRIAVAAILVLCASAWVFLKTADRNPSTPSDGSSRGEWVGAWSISPEEAMRVFQMHESIAGPIAWLAIQPDSVQVRNDARANRSADVIACFLSINQQGADTFPTAPILVICRPEEKATLTIPSVSGRNQTMRIQLVPITRDGAVGVQYAIGIEDLEAPGAYAATLSGFIPVSDAGRSVGQLVDPVATLNVALRAAVLSAAS